METSLSQTSLGPLPSPLSALVFNYDKFSGFASTQVCEAAYLASQGIDVRVLVSPASYYRMQRVYENLPNFPEHAQKPSVIPLFLEESQLNVERMMKLMAIDGEGRTALYMEASCYCWAIYQPFKKLC